MHEPDFSKHWFSREAATQDRRRSQRKLATRVRLLLGALVLAFAALVFLFGGALLGRIGRMIAEHAFAAAHPRSALQIGALDFAVLDNRLVAQAVVVRTAGATVELGRLSLTGVHWVHFLWGRTALADAFAEARLDVTGLKVEFPQAHYGIRCARLQGSVPDSSLVAEHLDLQALIGDEAFFAAHEFRKTRFQVVVPVCTVSGLAYRELLAGQSYRARSVRVVRPTFDALVDRDKPVDPSGQRPLMVHDALAAIQQPLRIDSFSLSEGRLTYRERVAAGSDPGVLTFGTVNVSAAGIANRGDATAAIELQAQGNLMDAGTVKLAMSIPINPPSFSVRYSGSLGAMDLTSLNAFLAVAEHTRVKSGRVQAASFDVTVTAGQASGRVQASYENLELAFLDKQTGSENGIDQRVLSFLAKELKFRGSNSPDGAGAMKEGKVDYTIKPEDQFLQIVWLALRSGALDVVSH